ncbi:MAG: hypothetical protein JSV33_09660 [bacterium]|nr:MAG: hypothetical protein JSV33_09660 [bacterium]
MKASRLHRTVTALLFCACLVSAAYAGADRDRAPARYHSPGRDRSSARYHSPAEVEDALKRMAKGHRGTAAISSIAETPGGRPVHLLEIGPGDAAVPAILVVANMGGDCPIATEAALRLSELLLGEWADDAKERRWYIVPLGNPDGHRRFFTSPLDECFVNAHPVNDDNDDATDEDGPEDLNGDSYITRMRQRHPEGAWLPVADNPVLMKRADAGKGEIGLYRLFTEGIDNDGDGRLNEDGAGGVNPGRNFPHGFEHYTETGGPWAASEAESRAILRFAFDHPEIAMVLVFGRTNNLKKVPESSRKAEAAAEKYKVPERMAKRFGLDPETEYPLKELVAIARDVTGYRELTEDMVLIFLGVGAAVNPDRRDLPYWNEASKRYNVFLEEVGLDGKRLEPPASPPGSIEEWAYFQYGTPAFSIDFWTLPVKEKKKESAEGPTPDEIEKMSNEEFIELGSDRIDAIIKASGAPGPFTAEQVIKALESGMITTAKIAGFIRKAEKKEEAGGADETDAALYDFDTNAFVVWEGYDHPTLGEVEIGGKVPYAQLAPPAAAVESLIVRQLPFVRKLAAMLPRIAVERVEVERVAAGVWRVDAWVGNKGFFPYPTYQGERCKRPTPVAVTIEGKGIEVMEGRKRLVTGLLEGSGGSHKVSWLVRGDEGVTVKISAQSFGAGSDERAVSLKGGGA